MRIAYGRLRLSPKDFGEITLSEFSLAVEGFGELEAERLKWSLYNTRRICYYAIRPHLDKGSSLKEQDLFPIPEIDKEIEELNPLQIAKVITDE